MNAIELKQRNKPKGNNDSGNSEKTEKKNTAKQHTLLDAIRSREQVRQVARDAPAKLPAVVLDDVVERGLRQRGLAFVREVEALEDFPCSRKEQRINS